uniref:Uncharacterized protein n=1 Tax=Salix viminalis TaxID=40686 RepID=A0A6N2JXP0_SALVM
MSVPTRKCLHAHLTLFLLLKMEILQQLILLHITRILATSLKLLLICLIFRLTNLKILWVGWRFLHPRIWSLYFWMQPSLLHHQGMPLIHVLESKHLARLACQLFPGHTLSVGSTPELILMRLSVHQVGIHAKVDG